ncbi:hypothetical protein ACOSQ2_027502 [Xanthoceras sorbifolium]
MTLSCLSELARLISVSWWSWWWDVLIEVRNTRLIPTLLATTLVLAISFYAWSIKKPFSSFPPLPPGPPGLPLLGNLLFLHSSTWSSNGPEWRKLRKIFIQELMNKTSLDACHALRPQEIREMVKDLYAKVGSPINIGDQMFLTLLNVIMSMSWGGGGGGGGGGLGSLHKEDKSRVGIQFRQMVGEFIELWGAPNISDLFPVLARFDLQGVESKMKKRSLWFDKFFESLIDSRMKDHQRRREQGEERQQGLSGDLILLELTQQEDGNSSLTMNQVKGLLLDNFLGGTHTSLAIIEWVMAELLQHPKILRKACKELKEVVGNDNNTFRLYPPVPLLPITPSTTLIISEYTIPKGSRLFFNLWAMQRDPETWENPLQFQPERFLRDAGKGDYQGNNFNFLPFGSGRRICPGIPLGEKMVLYVLASLLHSFDWKLPEGSQIDLTDKFGLALNKQEPLIAIPIAKLSSSQHYY